MRISTIVFCCALVSMLCTMCAERAQEAYVTSPSGDIVVDFVLESGQPHYRVSFKGQPVITSSPLG
ncbi:MAG: glycoside hydrolase family 97 N-terminal domain-containing protein, partial [Saprospiraceae bacterium]|nr:glycoside hydrolase family 97 N-terminal domain-containing protein [Saprospiraceae bacterium]